MAPIHAVLLLFAFLLPACLCASHEPGPYDFGLDAARRFRKRQYSQSFVVGGLPRVNGTALPMRPDIRELHKDEDKWNLYILALSWMQYTDQTSPFSYYQIAGIHGSPGASWGNVEAVPGSDGLGYCQHVSIIFPTWHRPYIALYEQTLYNIMQYIASLYPPDQLARFTQAASSFRLPYWDWAATPPEGDSVLPLSVGGSSNVTVSGPNGVQLIANPLYSYSFKPLINTTFPSAPYDEWNETKRAPVPPTAANAVSNSTAVLQGFDSILPSLQQRIYNLFSNYGNYTDFSNEAWIPYNNNGTYDSLESVHDTVHIVGGGGWGHMAIIDYSSYDPMFFLHHANVDRLFTMWQAIYNGTWVTPTAAVYSTHTMGMGSIQDAQTGLTPFYANGTSFWTSDMVRNHEIFGYTYAEVANKNRSEVIATVNSLYTDYSPATMTLVQNGKLQMRDKSRGAYVDSAGLVWNQKTSSRPPLDAVFDGNTYREWIANVRVEKHALGSSFSIYLFSGTAPDDTALWSTAENLVGELGVFAGSQYQPGSSEDHTTIAGTIPLTSALMKLVASGTIPSLRAGDIEPFLRSKLKLGVALHDGTEVAAGGVGGLHISIVSSLVTAATSEATLARWGQVESHFDLI
ncbi:hypothetical protein GGR56DRAFT_219398 [Xylariaceae sp. FL0804]|nr:hypothetical protein GGR56DRAFT_219398 [Xylariaceae sp. FL0804]